MVRLSPRGTPAENPVRVSNLGLRPDPRQPLPHLLGPRRRPQQRRQRWFSPAAAPPLDSSPPLSPPLGRIPSPGPRPEQSAPRNRQAGVRSPQYALFVPPLSWPLLSL